MKTLFALVLASLLVGCAKPQPVIRYVVIAPDNYLLTPMGAGSPPLRETFNAMECTQQREALVDYSIGLLSEIKQRDDLFEGLRKWKVKQLELYKSKEE